MEFDKYKKKILQLSNLKMEDSLHRKDIIGHIMDLKALAIQLTLCFIASFSVCYYFHAQIVDSIKMRFLNGHHLHYFTIEAPFFLSMKLSFLCSLVLFMPFLVFFSAKYLLPIFKNKSLIILYSILALLLFFIGICLGFFYIAPLVVNFMFQMAEPSISFSLNASSFFNTIFMLCVMFGLVFEIPIVIFALLQMRVISLEKIRKFRKLYIVLSFIIGAVITPPDVISQVIVALLLIALFEITIVIFSLFGKKNAEV